MNPYHYAAVVGITNYPGISDLDGPLNDAKDFRAWLESDGGVPDKNIEMLTTENSGQDLTNAEPFKRQLDDVLELIHNKMTSDTQHDPETLWNQSRLYVFLAGHGIMPRSGENALLLANARKGRYENFEVSQYLTWYQREGGIFKEVVFFTDCCRNWYDKAPASGPPFDFTKTPCPQVFSLAGYACGPGDPAYEEREREREREAQVPPDERRGYFTRALLKGLRGAAPIDPIERVITSSTLAPYVGFAVMHATRGKSIPQHVTMPSSDLTHPICFNAPSVIPTNKVTIRFPQAFARAVELRHPNGTREPWTNAPKDWPLTLPDGLYQVVESQTGSGSSFQHDGMFAVIGDGDVQL
jgi:Caspase domain